MIPVRSFRPNRLCQRQLEIDCIPHICRSTSLPTRRKGCPDGIVALCDPHLGHHAEKGVAEIGGIDSEYSIVRQIGAGGPQLATASIVVCVECCPHGSCTALWGCCHAHGVSRLVSRIRIRNRGRHPVDRRTDCSPHRVARLRLSRAAPVTTKKEKWWKKRDDFLTGSSWSRSLGRG